jgi:phosphatidylglycerol lysyltransferase
LVEPETLAQLQDRRVFVALRDRRVAGFLVATPIPQRNGWLIEQIVRGANAPNGLAEFLVDTAMQRLALEGSTYVTLGLAPLSRHAHGDESPHPLWIRAILRWMRMHGQRFYNFDGLDSFKAKLQPDSWEPVYALTRDRWVGGRALYAITGAFGGESPLIFLSRALVRAASQEWHWLRQRV